jgi:hypothetical protein
MGGEAASGGHDGVGRSGREGGPPDPGGGGPVGRGGPAGDRDRGAGAAGSASDGAGRGGGGPAGGGPGSKRPPASLVRGVHAGQGRGRKGFQGVSCGR